MVSKLSPGPSRQTMFFLKSIFRSFQFLQSVIIWGHSGFGTGPFTPSQTSPRAKANRLAEASWEAFVRNCLWPRVQELG